jgi:hypothetical protein
LQSAREIPEQERGPFQPRSSRVARHVSGLRS